VEPLIFFTSSKVGFPLLFAALADPDYFKERIVADQQANEKIKKKHKHIRQRVNDMINMISDNNTIAREENNMLQMEHLPNQNDNEWRATHEIVRLANMIDKVEVRNQTVVFYK
jgi:hypothetical protein